MQFSLLKADSSIEVVLFDCDGVMCDPLRFAEALGRHHGITKEVTTGFFEKEFLQALVGKIDVKELLPPFLARWGWGGTCDEFLSLRLASERHVRQEMIEIPVIAWAWQPIKSPGAEVTCGRRWDSRPFSTIALSLRSSAL
jgi:hypothetical protein